MPLPIDVKPYVLNGVLGGDNYLTHYKAVDASGDDVIITEFFPQYMVKRLSDGNLEISERFQKEFVESREEFVRRAGVYKNAQESSLHPAHDVFERNNTAYVVRRACGLTSIIAYMGAATMDFDEAYYFIRPLLISMARLADKGVLFSISPEDFRVSSAKQLTLAAPLSWDENFQTPLTLLAKLYYRLVTGAEASDQGVTAISAYGIEIPPRIESLIMDILTGETVFGSLDDFYKNFKSLIDGTKDDDDGKELRTLSTMRTVAAALTVLVFASLPFLAFAAVRAHRESTFWARPEVFADSAAPEPVTQDFSAITLTHPRNDGDAITGSFAVADGFLFFRGSGGLYNRRVGEVMLIPGAAGMAALAENRLIVPGAAASFIVSHGRDIFFADMNAGGAIFRTNTLGDEVAQITDHPALHLAVIGDFLFYASVNDNHRMYRIDLTTNTRRRVTENPVRAAAAYGMHLFFIEETDRGKALYAWELEQNSRTRIATDAIGNLRVNEADDTLFYLSADNRVRSMNFDGGNARTFEPQNVRTFDILFQWIFFAEEGRLAPRAYNRNIGEFVTLASDEWVSYIWVWPHGESVYALDYRDPALSRNFDLP